MVESSAIWTRSRNEPSPYLMAISNVRFRISLFEMDIKYDDGLFRDLVQIATGDSTLIEESPLLHFSIIYI